MITLHCLEYSRAIRLAWLMEDLHQPYDLIIYERTEDFHAPQSLARVHPLGKSPVMEDADLVLAESATCLRYLTNKFGDDTHQPKVGTRAYWRHEELLDCVESSFAPAAMGLLLPKLQGEEPAQEARAAMQTHLDHVAQQLTAGGLLFGETATLADIQFSYLLANLSGMGFLNDAPRIASYWADLQQQPGYLATVAKTGPMAPPS